MKLKYKDAKDATKSVLFSKENIRLENSITELDKQSLVLDELKLQMKETQSSTTLFEGFKTSNEDLLKSLNTL
jgi:hypothetical protein